MLNLKKLSIMSIVRNIVTVIILRFPVLSSYLRPHGPTCSESYF